MDWTVTGLKTSLFFSGPTDDLVINVFCIGEKKI